jgi:hypothetical protein
VAPRIFNQVLDVRLSARRSGQILLAYLSW